jgi:signal transduction histidine kinase
MPDGGRLRLGVAADSVGKRAEVVLTVEDEGRGIPADEIDTIFQPFHSTFEKGTGLGLAIVHRIVTDYGGTIQVSSAVGKGTAMRVRMPSIVGQRVPNVVGQGFSPADHGSPNHLRQGFGGPPKPEAKAEGLPHAI